MRAYPGLTLQEIGDMTEEQIEMLAEDDGDGVDPRTGRPVREFSSAIEAAAYIERVKRDA